ncbi:Proline-rich acidic protein 1 [Saguinus oedipus]|uniref:Proline-rich acidic protein 1 n=1 Tax=Saguinus oedipus TaxID=9490 RepID=A0ABQ9VSZ8_SAGOE|nr:Proline-rich acidic protein 1 [Saguinus oedipus]
MPNTGNGNCSSLSTLYAETGIPDIRKLLVVTSLLAVLLWGTGVAPAPKVPVKVQVKHQPSEQDAAKAWGACVVEPTEKDNQLVGVLPVQKPKLLTAEEKPPGTKAWVETKDILGHVLSPQQGPEPSLA